MYPRWIDLLPADQDASEFYDFADAAHALGYRVVPIASGMSQTISRTRAYASQYIGVTTKWGRWLAQWDADGRRVQRLFGDTPEDERRAAECRARALGLAEPEVRR